MDHIGAYIERSILTRGDDDTIKRIRLLKSRIAKTEVGHFGGICIGRGINDLKLYKRCIEATQLEREKVEYSIKRTGKNKLHVVHPLQSGHR